MSNVLIVGYGVVGSNYGKEIARLNPEIYDKYKEIDTRTKEHHKIAVICVDTPRTEKDVNDIAEVVNAIRENSADYYLIKSTVLPDTAMKIANVKGGQVVFSPEYYGATVHSNHDNLFNFTIVAGEKRSCAEVIQELQRCYDGSHQFIMTGIKEAMIAKYMENSFLAMKVSFCNSFYDICEEVGVSYEEVREVFLKDPRMNPSHTFVYKDNRGWNSHCLNKDVPAIAEWYDNELLLDMIKYNKKNRTK